MNAIHALKQSRFNPMTAIRKYRAERTEKRAQHNNTPVYRTGISKNFIVPLKDIENQGEITAKHIRREFKVTKVDRVKTFLSTTARYTTAGATGGAFYGSCVALYTGQVGAIPIGAAIAGGIGMAGGAYTGLKQARRLTPDIKLKNRLITVRRKSIPLNRKYALTKFTCGAILTTISKKYSNKTEYQFENIPKTHAGWAALHTRVKGHIEHLEAKPYQCRSSKKKLKKLKQLDGKLDLLMDLHNRKSKADPERERLERYIKILDNNPPGKMTA